MHHKSSPFMGSCDGLIDAESDDEADARGTVFGGVDPAYLVQWKAEPEPEPEPGREPELEREVEPEPKAAPQPPASAAMLPCAGVLLAAALLALASEAPVDNIDRLLPPPLQAGLFAAIGWSLYLLSFDVLGLGAGAGALLTLQSARLWVPANLFGLGLWRASRKGVGEGRASGGEAHPAVPISHLFRRPAPHPNLHPRRQRARARP